MAIFPRIEDFIDPNADVPLDDFLAWGQSVQATAEAGGTSGLAPWGAVSAWASGQNYSGSAPRSVVTYLGETYVCKTTHTSSGAFDPANFDKIAQKGDDGAAGASYAGTSTTSLAIGTGSRTLTTQAGLAYVVGSRIRVASSASPTNFMEGVVTAYATTSLTFTADAIGGSGTLASWNLSVAGGQGTNGAAGPSYVGTSTTSLAIGTGSRTLTTQAGLAYVVGSRLRLASSASPTNFMEGVVTAYATTSLTFTSDKIGGTGTIASWNLSLAGEPGTNGAGAGNVIGPGVSVASRIAVFANTDGVTLADGGQTIAEAISAAAASAVSTIRNSVSVAFDTLAEIATELGLKAPLLSPAFTGTPTAPTATTGANTTQIATTAFTSAAIAAHVALADPHSQYTTAAEAATAASDAVAAHVAAADPHTQYLTAVEGDAAYGRLANPSTYSAQQAFAMATLTDAATVTWNGATQQVAKVTLAGNRAIAAVSNAIEGAYYELTIIQDATGSRVPTWASSGAGSYDFGAAGIPVLTTTPARADVLGFRAVTVAGTLKLRYLGTAKGFA